MNYIWLIWLAVAMGLLIRKITIYQSFAHYISAGSAPVSDIEILNRLSLAAQRAGIKKPMELWVNPLISSPLLMGFFHPCIVLPRADYSEEDFQYIALHELIHYKRGDMFYKWLVQITVCLHWFNPLVHLMGREIARACEFSCDEAVLTKTGSGSAQAYGKTLLDAMAAAGGYRENVGAVTLGENKELLKERLGAIMRYKLWSKAAKCLAAMLTFCVALGAAFIGVYKMGAAAGSARAQAASLPSGPSDTVERWHNIVTSPPDMAGPQQDKTSASTDAIGVSQGDGDPSAQSFASDGQSGKTDSRSADAERYYEDGSLPLFEIVFARMNEADQEKWLERIYGDDQIAFWGAAVSLLDEDSVLIRRYGEKTYEEDDIAYFSALAMHMGEDALEEWLDRALEDGKWNFQSMLFDMLGRGEEFDELEEKEEKEWEEARAAEYQAVGVTIDGKNYYYEGQLVNLFLDIRANQSFYTLDMNPKGTVNIKIIRGADDRITGVVYMTETEVMKLLGESYEDGSVAVKDGDDMEFIPVDLESVAAGEAVSLGKYTLSEGDEIRYDILAETGNGIEIFFAKGEDWSTVYFAAHIMRQEGEPLNCDTDFTVESPVKPGTYELFLRGVDSALGNVKGSVSIAR